MWHVAGGDHSLKIQLPSSYVFFFVLFLMMFWRCFHKPWLNQWMSDEGVYRTAPATPDLLIWWGMQHILFSWSTLRPELILVEKWVHTPSLEALQEDRAASHAFLRWRADMDPAKSPSPTLPMSSQYCSSLVMHKQAGPPGCLHARCCPNSETWRLFALCCAGANSGAAIRRVAPALPKAPVTVGI